MGTEAVSPSEHRIRLLRNAATAVGALLLLGGLGFVAMYVYSAVIARLGEPDQSLLFWYLPILFMGIALASAGLRLLRSGLGRRRSD